MLARGVLCRLAGDVPKTSTHDLPRISQLLQSTLFARNSASRPTVGAIARAFQATSLPGRREYATQTATTPTARVKKAVKKTAAAKKPAKKPAAKKKTAAKKPKRKAAAKKKAAPKKRVSKPKKVLTAEQKEAATIRELKKKALRAPKPPRASAWTAFSAEAMQGASAFTETQERLKEAAAKFKNLTPAEKEHYNHLAKERVEAQRAEYDAWVRQHTPEEIRTANLARTRLRSKLGLKHSQRSQLRRLVDDRQDTSRKLTPYIRFVKERSQSGDFKGIKGSDMVKLVANEWKALSASEKKKYEDEYEAAKAA